VSAWGTARNGTACMHDARRTGPVLRFRAVTATSEAPASFRSSSVRPGPVDLVRAGIGDILSRRRLISYLVRADLKKKGADTLLGNVWWVVDPLLQMLVYVVLVGVILQRGNVDAFPLFVFCAILPWKWFDSSVRDGTTSVVSQERLIKQIYFPKLVLPFASVMAGVVNFGFGLIPLVALTALVYPSHASLWLLLYPLVGVVQLVFSLAVATLTSAVNVFYRDVGNLMRHLLRIWFYLSPALYGMDQVAKITKQHEWVGVLYALNPFTQLFVAYRNLAYFGTSPDWGPLLVLLLVSTVLLLLSILFFKRVEPTFAKVL
jgi:homopolymeric O-antigen transport system permease protein